MSDIARSVRVLVLVGATAALGACSTFGWRGNTQSASGLSEPQYERPVYSNHQSRPAVDYANAPPSRRTYAAPQRERAVINYHEVARAHPIEAPNAPPHVRQSPPVTRQAIARRAAPQPPVPAATQPNYDRTGWARWMGKSWQGHKTASGEIFDPQRLTAAHASLPLPSFVYITNRANGRTVLVRVNDRVPAGGDRVAIVSRLTADLLDFRSSGRAHVDLQYAGPAAANPNSKHEEAFLKQQPWFHTDLLHGNRNNEGFAAESSVRRSGRYPTPTYPRWDNTRRP